MRRAALARKTAAAVLALLLVLAPAMVARADFTVQLRADPEDGGTVTGGGTYPDGSNVDILATPADGYTFIGWYRDGETEPFTTSPNYTYEQEADRTYIARFEKAVSVTVSAEPAQGGTVTQNGGGSYIFDESVTVTAAANPSYAFVGWFLSSSTADPVSVDQSYTFNVHEDTNLIARFTSQHQMHVNISPEGAGTVMGNGTFAGGSIVTLEAIPNDDYRFVAWVSPADPDTVVSEDNPYSFNLDGDLTLTATFARSYGYIWLRIGIVAAAVAGAAFLVWYLLRRRTLARMSGSGGGRMSAERAPKGTRWRWKWSDGIRRAFEEIFGQGRKKK